jgi:hypothetical protein
MNTITLSFVTLPTAARVCPCAAPHPCTCTRTFHSHFTLSFVTSPTAARVCPCAAPHPCTCTRKHIHAQLRHVPDGCKSVPVRSTTPVHLHPKTHSRSASSRPRRLQECARAQHHTRALAPENTFTLSFVTSPTAARVCPCAAPHPCTCTRKHIHAQLRHVPDGCKSVPVRSTTPVHLHPKTHSRSASSRPRRLQECARAQHHTRALAPENTFTLSFVTSPTAARVCPCAAPHPCTCTRKHIHAQLRHVPDGCKSVPVRSTTPVHLHPKTHSRSASSRPRRLQECARAQHHTRALAPENTFTLSFDHVPDGRKVISVCITILLLIFLFSINNFFIILIFSL